MPLMSEGKSGPNPTKLRAIWRREAKHRDQQRETIADQQRRGVTGISAELARETLDSIERTLTGEAVPVGILAGPWRDVCAQMTEEERNPPAWLRIECPRCGAKPGERCYNYAGTHCAPHRDRTKPPAPKPAAAPKKPTPPPAPSLFDLGDGQGDGQGDE